jgi:hypothetical protein
MVVALPDNSRSKLDTGADAAAAAVALTGIGIVCECNNCRSAKLVTTGVNEGLSVSKRRSSGADADADDSVTAGAGIGAIVAAALGAISACRAGSRMGSVTAYQSPKRFSTRRDRTVLE